MEIKNREFFAEIKGNIAKIQFDKLQMSSDGKYIDANPSTHLISEYMYGMIQDYEDVNTDKKRLVREIDVILCGKDAAIQASLCDLIPSIRDLKEKYDQLVKNEKAYLEAIKVNNMVITEIYSHFGNEFDFKAKTDTEKLLETNKIILSE